MGCTVVRWYGVFVSFLAVAGVEEVCNGNFRKKIKIITLLTVELTDLGEQLCAASIYNTFVHR